MAAGAMLRPAGNVALQGPPVLTAPAFSTTGSYMISWTSVASASAYELRERQGSSDRWETIHYANKTSAAVHGNPTGRWSYEVRACQATECSGWSATQTTEVTL
jgi:hypothetical protein